MARAVVPVLGGIGFFVALFGITWLIAVAISGKGEDVRLGDREFVVGRVDRTVQRIDQYGPLLFADLKGTAGEQAVVLDHDPNALDVEGWTLWFAYRADRGPDCLVQIDQATQRLRDCDGNPVVVTDLEPAEPEATVVVELGKQPQVKIRFAAAQVPGDTTASTTSP